MSIETVLEIFDDPTKKDFAEFEVSSEIKKVADEREAPLSQKSLAEMIAFDFTENYNHPEGGWNTYFGPKATWPTDDGKVMETPSIKVVTPEIIEYWTTRAQNCRNPLLKARYAGLVYDFQNIVTGTRSPLFIADIYINSLIEIADGNYGKYKSSIYIKLERALRLSISLNKKELVNKSSEALINYEKNHSTDPFKGPWGKSYDLLLNNSKVSLNTSDEHWIIQELERKLYLVTDTNGVKIDPWAGELAAEKLATYYRKKNQAEDVKRVILRVGSAVSHILPDGSGLQVSSWLDRLHKLYIKFNLQEEAEAVLKEIRALGPRIASSLKSVSHTYDLPGKEFEQYINQMLSGPLEDILTRLTVQYIPIKEQVKEQIFDLSRRSPTMYFITHQLQDDKGRVIAKIGPLETDLDGHIVRQISQNLSFSSIFIRQIISRAIENHGLTKNQVLTLIKKSAIIEEDRIEFIEKGLDAFFKGDHIVALHLLIPQIEQAIRNSLEFQGGIVLKPSKGGGYHLKTFDEVLRDSIVINTLSEDLADYFRILFTDQRGWNLRNSICHGFANITVFNAKTSDRIFHALLCLSLIQKQSTEPSGEPSNINS